MFYSRKSPRIPGYNYTENNYYFITVCTHEKKCIFGTPKNLSFSGKIVFECIKKIEEVFPGVFVDASIVMPNHIHLILANENNKDINLVIAQLKSAATRKIRRILPGQKVWQRSFHDHIIRNQREYEEIWKYVTYNYQKWEEDCFYSKE